MNRRWFMELLGSTAIVPVVQSWPPTVLLDYSLGRRIAWTATRFTRIALPAAPLAKAWMSSAVDSRQFGRRLESAVSDSSAFG